MKTCCRCKQSKPISEYRKCSRSRDGLWYRCNHCQMEYQRAWKANNQDKVKANQARNKAIHGEKNKIREKQWCIENRERVNATQRKNYAKNKEHFKKMAEARISKDPELHKAKKTAYYQANKGAAIARARKYQMLRKRAMPAWANDFFIKEAYVLAKLREVATGLKWHVDHIVPLTSNKVCGLHCEQNLQVITMAENMAKGNRIWPNMWESKHA